MFTDDAWTQNDPVRLFCCNISVMKRYCFTFQLKNNVTDVMKFTFFKIFSMKISWHSHFLFTFYSFYETVVFVSGSKMMHIYFFLELDSWFLNLWFSRWSLWLNPQFHPEESFSCRAKPNDTEDSSEPNTLILTVPQRALDPSPIVFIILVLMLFSVTYCSIFSFTVFGWE